MDERKCVAHAATVRGDSTCGARRAYSSVNTVKRRFGFGGSHDTFGFEEPQKML
jgi:hypothetical protein